jgi:hypothetical protein
MIVLFPRLSQKKKEYKEKGGQCLFYFLLLFFFKNVGESRKKIRRDSGVVSLFMLPIKFH